MRTLPFLLIATACSPPQARSPVALETPPEPGMVAIAALTAPGLSLDTDTWQGADDSRGTVWRIRVHPGALSVLPSASLQPLSTFQDGLDGDAWVIANGGFYDPSGTAMSLVVHDGQEHHALGSGSGVVTGPSPVHVVHKDAYVPGPTEALQSIDRVVDNATNLVTMAPAARRAARTVLAVDGETVWIAVFADERSIVATPAGARLVATGGFGPTLYEAAEYVRTELAAQQALNMDGAISTQFAVHTPSGDFVVQGERDIINAVVLTPTTVE